MKNGQEAQGIETRQDSDKVSFIERQCHIYVEYGGVRGKALDVS